MNFSEEGADEDMPSQEPIRPSTKWSLLQKFICQNNLQRFTDNLEDISKEIRCPTPTYIKKKKTCAKRKIRQNNSIYPNKFMNQTMYSQALNKTNKEINSKLLSPISKDTMDTLCSTKSNQLEKTADNQDLDEVLIEDQNIELIRENSPEPKTSPEQSENQEHFEPPKAPISISFGQIYGAFCKRYLKSTKK
eukprot:CAMPEP_0168343020 /NCGR_PEP_ID=MMETSP0213-20121227/15784_1 /TAXON_ID=151035 /ORGANISM="Euplotes harpa, Strain FSP1.4" /LENGTH=191 /DNA_ID=CAMNT_0008350115 /DNA_START=419 /DNA_END=991 /DNA_ORIENTATION=+